MVQHAPPNSIYEIETHDSAEDLIMIVAIISAVSAGGVLLLVVIAIVAFAMIAARSPDADDPSSLEVARVVAQPGMHIPQSVPPQRRRPLCRRIMLRGCVVEEVASMSPIRIPS